MKPDHYLSVYAYMTEHARENIYEIAHAQRVLCNALLLAEEEEGIDLDVLVPASLLHDIGTGALERHAVAGSRKARAFLLKSGWPESVAEHVADCISTHSLTSGAVPRTREAKILFDADKLDLIGAVGTARAIEHCVLAGEPLYVLGKHGLPGSGKKEEPASLFKDYRRKLKKLPSILLTAAGRKLADKNRRVMDDFFAHLEQEVKHSHARGMAVLEACLRERDLDVSDVEGCQERDAPT